MATDYGANPALAKAEPVSRLGPSGFDPSRKARRRYDSFGFLLPDRRQAIPLFWWTMA